MTTWPIKSFRQFDVDVWAKAVIAAPLAIFSLAVPRKRGAKRPVFPYRLHLPEPSTRRVEPLMSH